MGLFVVLASLFRFGISVCDGHVVVPGGRFHASKLSKQAQQPASQGLMRVPRRLLRPRVSFIPFVVQV